MESRFSERSVCSTLSIDKALILTTTDIEQQFALTQKPGICKEAKQTRSELSRLDSMGSHCMAGAVGLTV